VAVLVVQFLEMVDVEEHQRGGRTRRRAFQRVQQPAAVGQSGQCIAIRKVEQACIRRIQLGGALGDALLQRCALRAQYAGTHQRGGIAQ